MPGFWKSQPVGKGKVDGAARAAAAAVQVRTEWRGNGGRALGQAKIFDMLGSRHRPPAELSSGWPAKPQCGAWLPTHESSQLPDTSSTL
jgi:hypothetical protein